MGADGGRGGRGVTALSSGSPRSPSRTRARDPRRVRRTMTGPRRGRSRSRRGDSCGGKYTGGLKVIPSACGALAYSSAAFMCCTMRRSFSGSSRIAPASRTASPPTFIHTVAGSSGSVLRSVRDFHEPAGVPPGDVARVKGTSAHDSVDSRWPRATRHWDRARGPRPVAWTSEGAEVRCLPSASLAECSFQFGPPAPSGS
jgi:hypothetical protein